MMAASHLNRGLVLYARRQVAQGATIRAIADEFGWRDERTLQDAVRGRTWTHLNHIVPPVHASPERAGSSHPGATLTDEQVLEARRRARLGENRSDIARDLGVSPGLLRAAIRGRSWKHLDEIEPPVEPSTSSRGSGNRKLTADAVRDIRRRRAAAETLQTLADEYEVTPTNIHLIVTRQTWTHVD
jgi:transposase-like protein